MHFIGQNRNRFYMDKGPQTFFWGHLAWENDIIFKISHRKKLWRPTTAHKLTQEPFSIVRLLNTKKKSTPSLRLSVTNGLERRGETFFRCSMLSSELGLIVITQLNMYYNCHFDNQFLCSMSMFMFLHMDGVYLIQIIESLYPEAITYFPPSMLLSSPSPKPLVSKHHGS